MMNRHNSCVWTWGMALGLVMCLLMTNPSTAVTFDLSGGAPASGVGNSFTAPINGMTATVSSFSIQDTNLAFLPAELNVNAQGIGICHQAESHTCGGLRPAISNVGFVREFVLLEFNSSVFLNNAILTAQGSTTVPGTDSDATFFVGTGATPNFLNLANGDLGMAFHDTLNVPGTLPNGTTRLVNLASQVTTSVNWLLLGAHMTDPDPEDFFRLTTVSVSQTPVPEPETLFLFGIGLLGLIIYYRTQVGRAG